MIPTKPSGYSVPDALSEQDSMEREILDLPEQTAHSRVR